MSNEPPQIETILRPEGTVVINPTGMAFTYQQANGQEIISVLVDTTALGAFQIPLTVEAAGAAAQRLASMVGGLPALRSEWAARHPQ
ncbi:hypothetical protein AWC11_12035 [Mycobacterium interjectum]|nr:hypothetical protein AWC11_12035 [Mycobacterium interjectum]